MAGEGDKISCPFCRRELDDTHEPTILCKFCGKKFRRVDVFDEDEKAMRQNMIIDLSTYMAKLKTTKTVALILAALSLAAVVVMLFGEQVVLQVIILLVAILICLIVWVAVYAIHERKYSKNQSKLFDLTGGRRLE